MLQNDDLASSKGIISPIDMYYRLLVFLRFVDYLLKNRAEASPQRCCFMPTTVEGFRGPLETVIDSHVKLQGAARRGLFPCGLTDCMFFFLHVVQASPVPQP